MKKVTMLFALLLSLPLSAGDFCEQRAQLFLQQIKQVRSGGRDLDRDVFKKYMDDRIAAAKKACDDQQEYSLEEVQQTLNPDYMFPFFMYTFDTNPTARMRVVFPMIVRGNYLHKLERLLGCFFGDDGVALDEGLEQVSKKEFEQRMHSTYNNEDLDRLLLQESGRLATAILDTF